MATPPTAGLIKRPEGALALLAPPTSITEEHVVENAMVSEGNATGVSRPETKDRERKEDRLEAAEIVSQSAPQKTPSPPTSCSP